MDFCICSRDDRLKAIDLINNSFKDTLAELSPTNENCPYFLSDKNKDNIIISKDKSDVVSTAVYYHSKLLLNGALINMSTVGKACTKERYLGEGVSEIVLQFGGTICNLNNSSIIISNQTSALFEKEEFIRCTSLNQYEIEDYEYNGIGLIPYSEKYLDILISIYRGSCTRFIREREEFEDLIKHSLVAPLGKARYLYLISKNDIYTGYLLVEVDMLVNEVKVLEWAGDSSDLIEGLNKLKLRNKNYDLIINVPNGDSLDLALKANGYYYTRVNQNVSLKVINPEGLFDAVKPFLCEKYGYNLIKDLAFKNKRKGCSILYQGEKVQINNYRDVTRLFFDNNRECLKKIKNKNIKTLMEEIFPLEFINISGMNNI